MSDQAVLTDTAVQPCPISVPLFFFVTLLDCVCASAQVGIRPLCFTPVNASFLNARGWSMEEVRRGNFQMTETLLL